MSTSPDRQLLGNLVERFFADITEKQIRRDVHHSTEELETAILELPALVNGLGLRRACLGHRVSFRIRWAKDSPGPSGGVRDCRSLR